MNAPPEADMAAGMEVYASAGPGCRAQVKQTPGDFLVEEKLGGLEVSPEPRPGLLPLYRVEKRDIDTLHMAGEMANVLKSRIAYAGMKDKRAVAVQYVTPTSIKSERPDIVDRPNFSAKVVGYVPRRVDRSLIVGNTFSIVLRECGDGIIEAVEEVFSLARNHRVPNFYGYQRFGASGLNTAHVGKALLMRRFMEAVELLIARPRKGDSIQAAEARRAMAEGRFREGSVMLPSGQDIERMVSRRMAERHEDPLGALRVIPIGLRRLYTQAYQSYIFNRSVSVAISRGLDIGSAEPGDNWGEVSEYGLVLGRVHGVKEPQTEGCVPVVQLVGYAYRDYGSRFDGCIEQVMEEEGVTPGQFYLKEMQEASVEGGFRRPFVDMRDESVKPLGKDAQLRFTLAKGEYATVLLREIVKPRDPESSGFA